MLEFLITVGLWFLVLCILIAYIKLRQKYSPYNNVKFTRSSTTKSKKSTYNSYDSFDDDFDA